MQAAPCALDYRIGGTRGAVVNLETPADVEHLRAVVNQDHTPPQGEANNIQRGLRRYQRQSQALHLD